jgi:ketosteroid isomerase-like protein
MPTTATPRQAFDALIGHISAGRWEQIADLYAEDTVVEIPFALPVPVRLEGREQLRAHFATATDAGIEMRARNVRVHETADPEVIVAEFDYHGRISSTDRDFDVANVQILTVRDGLIVATRDFHNHPLIAAASGQLPALVAALESPGQAGR